MVAMPCDSRSPGDARNIKQSIAELKLRRIEELNQRLQEDLVRRRIPVSQAASDLITFTESSTKDWMIPTQRELMGKHKDRYPPPQDNSCCTAM